jgi:hypothetical protein
MIDKTRERERERVTATVVYFDVFYERERDMKEK